MLSPNNETQERALNQNVLAYHGANVAFIDAQYRGRLLKLPDKVLDQILPFPQKEINIFFEKEKDDPPTQSSSVQNQNNSALNSGLTKSLDVEATIPSPIRKPADEALSEPKATEIQKDNVLGDFVKKYAIPIIATGLLGTTGVGLGAGALINNLLTQPQNQTVVDKLNAEIGIEVK